MKNSMPELPDAFPLPEKSGRPDILFIAGEHSGDELSAGVISKMLAKNPELKIAAFGGNDMRDAGAQLLFNMTTFSAVGLVEVVSNLSFYKKLFSLILSWIREHRPRAICFTDFPGMNLRLAKALKKEGLSRKGGGDISLFHYVSPQIWAWKAHRRFEMEKVLDSLGVLFPFELKCYEDTKLDVHFVGDPFAEPEHILPVKFDASAPVLLLPGSRPKPVARIFPILLGAWKIFRKTHPAQKAVVLHPGEPVLGILKNLMAEDPEAAQGIELVPVDSVAETQQPASAVLMSSGTMSRTCSLAGIPGAILYYANPLTWAIGRLLVGDKVRYLGMANILLDRDVYPEYLQKEATPENLAARLSACFDNPEILKTMMRDRDDLLELLRPRAGTPDAAEWILSKLEEKPVK
ncbi:MAG: lipid-A-disaccharide synthase [Verrucomicrobia bacterium]|nr:lipid-A-disaccharide synthase [Verrucomicrobiota bacterium]